MPEHLFVMQTTGPITGVPEIADLDYAYFT
jgi:hypothetical protein